MFTCKCARLTKSFSTVGTFERFFFGVNIAVVSQVVLPSEGFSTDVTGVGSLVRVRSLVDQQVVALGELPVAEFADEPLLRSR